MNTSGDARGGQRVVPLLGFLLLVSIPLVSAVNYTMLNSTSYQLTVDDALVSPSGIFEAVIARYPDSPSDEYYLVIRYSPPIYPAVTWIANRDVPRSRTAVLKMQNQKTSILVLYDDGAGARPSWSVNTPDNSIVSSAQLSDAGNLVLLNASGAVVWDSFTSEPPTDTLLPGQILRRNSDNRLTSWQANGDPTTVDGTYSFGWDQDGVLALSWKSPKKFRHWEGGNYIPAPDVYAAHRIADVDSVYFHNPSGNLYISGKGPDFPADTAILSGGPDATNSTVLKRLTIGYDGGLRIFQWTRGNSTAWKAVANWVVADRPETRSQCTTFGTCGPFGLCTSAIDDLEFVSCKCPPGFSAGNGCTPPNTQSNCSTRTSYEMLQLDGVDSPWGDDYMVYTAPSAKNCSDTCKSACWCAGAVFSSKEETCWLKSGILYNMGYPTEALYGTDRTLFLKNASVPDPPSEPQALPTKPKKHVTTITVAVVVSLVGFAVFAVFALFAVILRRRWN